MAILTILTTIHNEAKTIKSFLERLNLIPLEKEILIVDDGSTDGTDKIIRELKADNIKIIHHTTPRGKSAAFLTGLAHSSGDYILSVNTNSHFEPQDFLNALEALKGNRADFAVGTKDNKNYLSDKIITVFLNLTYSGRLKSYVIKWKLASRNTWNEFKNNLKNFDSDLKVLTFALAKKKQILEIEERL